MGKDRKKKKKKNQKRMILRHFLRKSTIYLGLIGLFIIFAVPELTKGDLD